MSSVAAPSIGSAMLPVGASSSLQLEDNPGNSRTLGLKDDMARAEAHQLPLRDAERLRQQVSNYRMQQDSLLGTARSTNLDSVGEGPMGLDSADERHELDLVPPKSWTYPARAPSAGRKTKRRSSSQDARLRGDTASRLSAAARRRELISEDPPVIETQSVSRRSSDPSRSASRCFEDLYADALERHRRFKIRVAKILEEEDAQIAEVHERYHQEYLQNQSRVSGSHAPDTPLPGSHRRELRRTEVEAQKLAEAQKEAEACTFHPDITPRSTPKQVSRFRSASTTKSDRSYDTLVATAPRSRSVDSGSGIGARSVDHKVAAPF